MERSQNQPLQEQHILTSSDRVTQPKPSVTIHDSSASTIQEAGGSNKTYRSVLISDPPSPLVQDKRLVINDKFYQRKPSLFERLGSSKPDDQKYTSGGHKRANVEPIKAARRLSVETSGGLFLDPKVRNRASIKIKDTPLNECITRKSDKIFPIQRSLNEMTNKPLLSQAVSRTAQGDKSISTPENMQYRAINLLRTSRPIARAQTTV